MKKIKIKIFSCSLLLLLCVSAAGIDVYLGNLGSSDSNTENLIQIQDISSRLQINLLKNNNDAITYKLLNTTANETSADYLETVVDSKLNALGVSIFYNIQYVLFGSVYIDPETDLYTCLIKIYDKSGNNILYETNFSKIISSEDKASYTLEMAELINTQLYLQLTGKKYTKPALPSLAESTTIITPAPTVVPEDVPVLTPTPQPVQIPTSENTRQPQPTATSNNTDTNPAAAPGNSGAYDDEVKSYLKQILEILNQTGLQVPQNTSSETTPTPTAAAPTITPTPAEVFTITPTPTPTATSTITPAPTPQATTLAQLTPKPSPVLDLNLAEEFGPRTNGGPVVTRKLISLVNSAGYPFVLSGKWKGTLLPIISLEEGIKFYITLVNQETLRFALRPTLLLNYTFANKSEAASNYVVLRYHSFTPKVGLDLYFEYKERYGLFLGGGGQYKYNVIDFRDLSDIYNTDIEYAPGFYGELGFEFLLNKSRSLGLGINNIVDYTLFDLPQLDYKVILLLTNRL